MTAPDGGGPPGITWQQATVRRLARHGLSVPHRADPADVAADVAGVHAQIMSAAEVSLGLRLTSGTRGDVRRALDAHTLVKTHGPRGTVHLLAARDLPMWTGALGALPASSPFPPDVALTAAQTDDVVAAIADALADDELTVDELTREVVARAGTWAGDAVMPAFGGLWPRWRQAVTTAAHRGVLCFGVNRGRQVTYTHPGRYVPGLRPGEPGPALATLVRRYLGAYGPATAPHLAQWLAAPRGWAADLLASLDLRAVDLDGTPAWLAPDDTGPPPAAEPAGDVHLLPYFDAYVVGGQPRDRLFPGAAAGRALAGGQAGNFPVLLVDGVVAGVWHARRSGRRLDVTVEALAPLTADQRDAVARRVERIGEVLEATPRWAFGTVAVGPHA